MLSRSRELYMSTIYFFVKVFDNKAYANDFINGKIFANKLSFFRKYEEEESGNRGDKHEGVVGWHQPEKVILKINGKVISGLSAPISVQMNWHDHLNIFCVYTAYGRRLDELTHENIEAFKKQLKISSDCQKLGKYAVVIIDPKSFVDRISLAIKENNYGLTAGLVEYYDPNLFHGNFTEEKSIFKKRIEFKHQKEYRFAINTGCEIDAPIVLDVGSINDIATLCDVSAINSELNIEVQDFKNP